MLLFCFAEQGQNLPLLKGGTIVTSLLYSHAALGLLTHRKHSQWFAHSPRALELWCQLMLNSASMNKSVPLFVLCFSSCNTEQQLRYRARGKI